MLFELELFTICLFLGYLFSEIEDCVSWLAPLAVTIREANIPVFIKHFDNVLPDDMQNIQTHDVTLDLLVSLQTEVAFLLHFLFHYISVPIMS